jgi:hypothetical protein
MCVPAQTLNEVLSFVVALKAIGQLSLFADKPKTLSSLLNSDNGDCKVEAISLAGKPSLWLCLWFSRSRFPLATSRRIYPSRDYEQEELSGERKCASWHKLSFMLLESSE